MLTTTADLQRLVKAAAGVDILQEDQETFKSTYQILLEISKVWDTISDKNRSALLQKLAGKQNANVISAILQNGELLQQVYNEANDSAGVAMAEQEKWSQSIQANLNKISATFESISNNILSSDTFKDVLHVFQSMLDLTEKLTSNNMGLPALVTVLGTLNGAMGRGFFSAGSSKAVTGLIKQYNVAITKGEDATNKFISSVATTSPTFAKYASSLNGVGAHLDGYNKFARAAMLQNIKLQASTILVNTAINGLISLIIGGAVYAFNSLKQKAEEASKVFKESTETISSNLKELDDYKESIDRIVESNEDEKNKLIELGNIKDELSEKYRTEVDDINDVTTAREKLVDAIENQKRAELESYYAKNREQFEKNSKALTDVMKNELNVGSGLKTQLIPALDSAMTSWKQNVKDEKEAVVRDSISKLFTEFNTNSQNTAYGTNFNYSFNIDGENALDYYNKLKTVIDEINRVRSTDKRGLTEAEESLYQSAKERYDLLENWLTNDKKGDLMETFTPALKKMGEYFVEMNQRGSKSFEEWKNELLQIEEIASNPFLTAYIKGLTDSTDKIKESAKEVTSPLQEVLANLDEIKAKTGELTTSISTADDAFEKLTKTIKSNNDTNSYFSASEIIELLDLYPELSNAILESQYGYKIEKEAIENLRQAKLNEQKTALQTQLEETKALLDATKTKLDAYKQEIEGVKSVADAKTKLAELEKQIAIASTKQESNLPHHRKSASALQSEKSALTDYVTASEEADKYAQTIKKLQAQLNVLGQVHDDLKDSTQDSTKALDDQKNKIKELSDEYKKAKDSIQDLIDLTMDMIKKNKELEKQNLNNQLDGYKKLISASKELIDLKKEEQDFSKSLAEKNRDVLNVQQELEALSIAGVNYSLEDQKRKAELQQELVEKTDERNQYLYDHEVDMRKDALDKEQESFEEKINSQIDTIEDYLSREGKIREDAINLINSKTEAFYNDLTNYTMMYTDKSRYEFDTLWNDAYDALMKYGNGQINVEASMAYLIGQINLAENQINALESATNSLKNATEAFTNSASNGMASYNRVLDETRNKYAEIVSQIGEMPMPSVSSGDFRSIGALSNANEAMANWIMKARNIEVHHDGGFAGGSPLLKEGEILSKLVKGELVVNSTQAKDFVRRTMPNLMGAAATTNNSTNNSSNVNVVFNIDGNANQGVVQQLKNYSREIKEDIFKAINGQINTYNGRMITGY